MKRTAIALLVALTATASAVAQTCVPTDTPETCWEKFNPATTAASSVATAVANTNTGSPNLSSITNTTLRDFLSVFTGVVSTSTLTENNGAFTLDYNLPVNLLHDNDVIKFQATFATPVLDPTLVTALGTNASAITTLTDSLDQADDITASATFSPSTDRFGRTFANHRDLVEALMNAVMANRGVNSTPRLLAVFADAAAGNSALQLDTPFTVITDPAQQTSVIAKFQAAAASLPQFAAENQTLIDNVAELINNQEQIYFSAQYNDLNSLAGPSTWTVNGTYAMGGKNITKFLAAQKKLGNCNLGQMVKEQNSQNAPAVSQTCLQQLNAYVGPATIDRTWRLALSLDLSRTEANTIDISQLSTPISTPRMDSQMISLTAGRRFDPPSSGRERRIDVTASYENVSDDPNLQDRIIASVTWTQEITNTFSLPITLSYANKSKYLPEDDRDLSAHFAISYKLPTTAN